MKSCIKPALIYLACGCLISAQDYKADIAAGMSAMKAHQYTKATDTFGAAFLLRVGEPIDYYNAASAAAHSGNISLALRWLEHAYPTDEEWLIPFKFIAEGDTFASVRAADTWPAFQALREKQHAEFESKIGPVKAELLGIFDDDQRLRVKLQDVQKQFGPDSSPVRDLWKTASEIDAANQLKVDRILQEYGWLSARQVGWNASSALFLVIQHADLPYQKKYLATVRIAVKDGKARADELALLEDRVGLREGRRQIYGSQIYTDPKSGLWVVAPLDDPDHVDERRATVGLQPLAEYVRQWNIVWNAAEYKQELSSLEARLGLQKQ